MGPWAAPSTRGPQVPTTLTASTTTHHDGGDLDGNSESDDAHEETVDPHVWMDPLRVADAAESVVAALADVDPTNGDVYGANATPVEEELADRHDDIEATVAAGSTSTILVAGPGSSGTSVTATA